MKKNKVEPRCEYCERAYISKESGNLFCEKKGLVEPFDSCRRFKYDPLKRIPKKMNLNLDFSPEDFEI